MDRPVVLFLHLPKTAGTTLESVIYGQFDEGEDGYWRRPPGWVIPGAYRYFDVWLVAENGLASFFRDSPAEPPGQAVDLIAGPDVKVVMGHFSFGIHELLPGPTTYVTMLRDPVDRVVSLYHHLLEHPEDTPYHQEMSRNADSLERFVTAARCKETDNDQTRRIAGEDPPFGACTPALLHRAKENLAAHFSVVGITERFDESLMLMVRTLGWDRITSYLPHFVNPKRKQRAEIPPDELDAVRGCNELDIELYGYACGLLDDAIAKHEDLPAIVEAFRTNNERFIAQHRWW